MTLLGKKHGFFISAFILSFILFFLWTPFGKDMLLYEYTPEFCMRFPIVYIAFFLIGYSFEFLRSVVYNQMIKTQNKLTEIAERDALTGLKNRFWFNKCFFEEYDNKVSADGSLALIIDIDSFKNINDTYGHLAGDSILCNVCNTIRACLKAPSLLCRWGGEEFLAFVPSCDMDDAEKLCHTICESIEKSNYKYKEQEHIKTTVSIGAVYTEKNAVINLEELLYKADKNLYKSKKQGKNRVSLEVNGDGLMHFSRFI